MNGFNDCSLTQSNFYLPSASDRSKSAAECFSEKKGGKEFNQVKKKKKKKKEKLRELRRKGLEYVNNIPTEEVRPHNPLGIHKIQCDGGAPVLD